MTKIISIINKMISIADRLDDRGNFEFAATIDNCIKKLAAKYHGKEVKLNDPIRNPSGSKKKFHVYVKDGENVKKVQFGDPGMEIKRDNPKHRKSFRARHKCDMEEAKDKTKAKYWSCYQWRESKKVDN